MIVDTNTGDVLNPRIIHSRSRIVSHTYSHHHIHAHRHLYKPSGFTVATRVIGFARNVGGRVRRNSYSIFAIFVILLFYMSLVAKLTGKGTVFTFSGLLRYFTLIGESIESFSLVTFFRTYQDNATRWLELSNFRFDGILEILNPFLVFISPLIRLAGYVNAFIGFLGECFSLLYSFLISVITYLFGGLFM